MLSTKQINKMIINYCKEQHISRKKYKLFPLYIHLDGFSHSIGFIDHVPRRFESATTNYNSVGFSGYMSSYERNIWGYDNEHQRYLAYTILSTIPHYRYQNNAQEILF